MRPVLKWSQIEQRKLIMEEGEEGALGPAYAAARFAKFNSRGKWMEKNVEK
jgi:hypothetical protein